VKTFTGQKKLIAEGGGQFKYCCFTVTKIHLKKAAICKAAYTVMKAMRQFLCVFKVTPVLTARQKFP
jgi:hypothetical protein